LVEPIRPGKFRLEAVIQFSPAAVAAAALEGKIVDPSKYVD
jgi:homoaconitase/3-isopropylmalate dehydratase large subunit